MINEEKHCNLCPNTQWSTLPPEDFSKFQIGFKIEPSEFLWYPVEDFGRLHRFPQISIDYSGYSDLTMGVGQRLDEPAFKKCKLCVN